MISRIALDASTDDGDVLARDLAGPYGRATAGDVGGHRLATDGAPWTELACLNRPRLRLGRADPQQCDEEVRSACSGVVAGYAPLVQLGGELVPGPLLIYTDDTTFPGNRKYVVREYSPHRRGTSRRRSHRGQH